MNHLNDQERFTLLYWQGRHNRKLLEVLMITVDDIVADVEGQKTRIASIIALLNGIKAQLADALAGVTLPAGVQAKIDAIDAGLKAEAADLDGALNANVPPPPVTP